MVKGKMKDERVELHLPSSLAPFANVGIVSKNAIPLAEWPEDVYAGRKLSYGFGTLSLYQLPVVGGVK